MGIVIFLISVCVAVTAIFPLKKTQEQIQTYQMPYMADVKKAPTADQFNALLHALQKAKLMQTPEPEQPDKPQWFKAWPFGKDKK